MRNLTAIFCLTLVILLENVGTGNTTNLSDFYSDGSISAELYKIGGEKIKQILSWHSTYALFLLGGKMQKI
jgi:hypothetical protein